MMAATVSMVGRAAMAATEAMVAMAATEAMAGSDSSNHSNDNGGTVGKTGNRNTCAEGRDGNNSSSG